MVFPREKMTIDAFARVCEMVSHLRDQGKADIDFSHAITDVEKQYISALLVSHFGIPVRWSRKWVARDLSYTGQFEHGFVLYAAKPSPEINLECNEVLDMDSFDRVPVFVDNIPYIASFSSEELSDTDPFSSDFDDFESYLTSDNQS